MNETKDMIDLPDPPISAEIDLSGFDFMPLYIGRLQRSKAWLACKRDPALGFYLLNLWMRAWQESPAASLDDDDDMLADAAMCDLKTWKKVREKALRGWVKCSDGRLYHPVVAELAQDAWRLRQGYRDRAAKAREAKAQKKDKAAADGSVSSVTGAETGSVTDAETEIETGAATGLNRNRQGQGQGQGQDNKKENKNAPQGSAGALQADGDSEEAQLFKRGKALLGKSSGGQVKRLLQHHGGIVALARADLERAATKGDAAEYIGRILADSAVVGREKTAEEVLAEVCPPSIYGAVQ